MCSTNPKKWTYTWEAQSHSPNLKLFLFNSHTKPSLHCPNLLVQLLHLPRAHLLLTWAPQEEQFQTRNEETRPVSLRVPVPNVLIDPECPVSCRVLDDHIEVRLVMLLPVDHPLVSVLRLDGDGNGGVLGLRDADSDLRSLSSLEEGVQFYCRSCSATLTKSPIRHFVEMPSVNWREHADNWFGGCCCSFGGASEKLVNGYVNAYMCAKSVCYLSSAAVTLCKEDLSGLRFAQNNGIPMVAGENGLGEEVGHAEENCHRISGRFHCESERLNDNNEELRFPICVENPNYKGAEDASVLDSQPMLDLPEYSALHSKSCDSACHSREDFEEVGVHRVYQPSPVDVRSKTREVKANQRSFLNGFLGDGFMVRSHNFSTDIEWKQFMCHQCSTLLGAYPCSSDDIPIDDGVRLFKCYIATSVPFRVSEDLFRRYSLDGMFVDQVVETAKDELSFRTLVRDLKTKSPLLRVVIVNWNSWHCSGTLLDTEGTTELTLKSNLHPVVKVLFSDCRGSGELHTRALDDWEKKHLPNEVFMLRNLIEELIETLTSAKELLPPSCTPVQGFYLSSIRR